jgi:molybdopterin molybdotransferase
MIFLYVLNFCVTIMLWLSTDAAHVTHLQFKHYSTLNTHNSQFIMVTVEEAEKVILEQTRDYGTESIYFENALGRVLAENIYADRDLPPYNRVTMDGVAINYSAVENGIRSFKVIATQAAGDAPFEINHPSECIEIMTGAALPSTTDTVIRYEDLKIENGTASLTTDNIVKGQSIHTKGADIKQNEIAIAANQFITPSHINTIGSVGKINLQVKKLPKVVIISSGDELVEVNEIPGEFQIRKSNNYTIKAVLQQYKIQADMVHIPDDAAITREQIERALPRYDVIILCGGISMGKFDYVPAALDELAVRKLFYKVRQRPGKPFWFGKHDDGVLVFAFPGNPVSTFMCLHRYFLLWLEKSLGIDSQKIYAVLEEDHVFNPPLQYFLQVKLHFNEKGCLMAKPIAGNGSGDFANLADTDAFMELPLNRNEFKRGEAFRVWTFTLLR